MKRYQNNLITGALQSNIMRKSIGLFNLPQNPFCKKIPVALEMALLDGRLSFSTKWLRSYLIGHRQNVSSRSIPFSSSSSIRNIRQRGIENTSLLCVKEYSGLITYSVYTPTFCQIYQQLL